MSLGSPTMRIIFFTLLLFALVFPFSARAVEHTIVQWKKTRQCEIVLREPPWGNHWTVLSTHTSRTEAERQLAKDRKLRLCPASKSGRETRAVAPPPPPTAKKRVRTSP